jgi:hypothetical protein
MFIIEKLSITFYNNRSIGDELHYLYLCQNEQIQRLRATCIPSYYFTNTCQNKLNGIKTHVHNIISITNIK